MALAWPAQEDIRQVFPGRRRIQRNIFRVADTAKHLASWVGVCPGAEESAGVNYSHRSPKGSRQLKALLNQASNAAVKTKGSIFELIYRRLVPRLGHAQTIRPLRTVYAVSSG